MDASKKVFINSSWTAEGSVPQKSARGVELKYGQNAFATISAAKTKLGGFSGNGLYVADKNVKLTNVDGIAMISVIEPVVYESYSSNGTAIADAMSVKLAPEGEISIKANTTNQVIVQGYKKATIDGINDGNNADYMVVGGTNTASTSYSFAEKGGSIAWQYVGKTISTAQGDASISNVEAADINGFFYDYSDTFAGWESKSGEANITAAVFEGTPRSYANVTVKNTTVNGNFAGGNLKSNYAEKYSESAEGSTTDTWQDWLTITTSGKLVATDASFVASAEGYSDVTINKQSDFGWIDGTAVSYYEDDTVIHSVKGASTVDAASGKYTYTDRATGRATINDNGNAAGGSIIGYSTVTVADTTAAGQASIRLAAITEDVDDNGNLNLYGNRTISGKHANDDNLGGASESTKHTNTDTDVVTLNGTFTASSVDPANPVQVAEDIVGFNRVAISDTDVAGAIAGTRVFDDDAGVFDYGHAYNDTHIYAAVGARSAGGDESDTVDDRVAYKENATGTVTVTRGSVQNGVHGYSNVTVTDATDIEGEFEAGNENFNQERIYKRNLRGSNEIINNSVKTKETENANGTLTITRSVIGANNPTSIDDFQTIRLTNVAGSVNEGVEGGSYTENSVVTNTSTNGIEAVKESHTITNNATGALTATNNDGSVLDISTTGTEAIVGIAKVQITNVGAQNTVNGNIVGGNVSRSYILDATDLEDDSHVVTRFAPQVPSPSQQLPNTNHNADYAEGSDALALTMKLTGSVNLDNTAVTGSVNGYQTVTLAHAASITGDVNFYDVDNDGNQDLLVRKETQMYRRNVESHFMSRSQTANAALTLREVDANGNTAVGANVYDIGKLTMEDTAQIGGNVNMVTSNVTTEETVAHSSKGDSMIVKNTDKSTVAGTVVMSKNAQIAGDTIDGVKSLTMRGAVGELAVINGANDGVDGFNTSTAVQRKAVSKEGDTLTIAGGMPTADADIEALASYEMTAKVTSTAAANATLNYAQVAGVMSGFSKVTASSTDIYADIIGGKSIESASRKYTNVDNGGKVTVTDAQITSRTDTAQGGVTAVDAQFQGAGNIAGFQNVIFSNFDGTAGNLEGGNRVNVVQSSIYTISDPEMKSSKFGQVTSVTAAGNVTATGVNGGALTFANIDGGGQTGGFTTVRLTSASVAGDITATSSVEKHSRLNDGKSSNTFEDIMTSKYVGNVNISAGNIGDGMFVGGDINGYTAITLDAVTVNGDINADSPMWMTSKGNGAVRWTSDNPLTSSFSSVGSMSTSAVTTLVMSNAADVQLGGATNGADHIAKLTISGADTYLGNGQGGAWVDMRTSNQVGSSSITLKGDVYAGSEKNVDSRNAIGTVAITGVIGNEAYAVDQGTIEGVKTLTASAAFVGDIEGYVTSMAQTRNAVGVNYTSTTDAYGIIHAAFDDGTSGTYKRTENWNAKAAVTLTDATANWIEGAATVKLTGAVLNNGAYSYSGKETEEWTWSSADAEGWKGNFERVNNLTGTLTANSTTVSLVPTQINGTVEGFAKIDLRDGTIVNGNFLGGARTVSAVYANGSGTRTTTVIVDGALTATGKTLADGTTEWITMTGDTTRFATVALDRTQVTGNISGGDRVVKESFTEHAYYDLGNEMWTYPQTFTPVADTLTAAGDLTVKNSEIIGEIIDLKTATFTGENNTQNNGMTATRVESLNVQDGVTWMLDFFGGDSNETVTAEANGTLQVENGFDFGDGDDVLNIAGTVRLVNDNATIDGLEHLGGSGILAMTDNFFGGDWTTVKATIGTIDSSLRIYHSDVAAVKAIRSQSYELGDNSGAGNTIAAVAGDTLGWMCDDATVGFEGTNGFVDTVDCFNFTVKDGTLNTFDLAFDYDDGVTLEGKLYKGSSLIDDTLADGWNSGALADGNYQIELKLTSTGNGQLAYKITRS